MKTSFLPELLPSPEQLCAKFEEISGKKQNFDKDSSIWRELSNFASMDGYWAGYKQAQINMIFALNEKVFQLKSEQGVDEEMLKRLNDKMYLSPEQIKELNEEIRKAHGNETQKSD